MRVLMGLFALLWTTGVVFAQVPVTGTFTAAQDCPAVQSIKKGTNPGDVKLRRGDSYALRGKNKDEATHYLIEVPGAAPIQRWVPVACGSIVKADGIPSKIEDAPKAESAFYILAISWQPAFCEGRPGKPECKSQSETGYDAKNFTLHGLWPQPRSNVFCGVDAADRAASEDGRWDALPNVTLSADVREGLDKVMPGTLSKLERHEWIKHGTCYGGGMETYYRDSVRLMEAVNASEGATFMAAHIGKTVKASDLRAKFDASLGAGAGDRMRFSCKTDGDRLLLTEITVGLKGDPSSGASLQELVLASSPTDPGCPEFVVDPVRLQ